MITENLSTLKIHKMTQDQFDREKANGRIEETALYLIPEEEGASSSIIDLGEQSSHKDAQQAMVDYVSSTYVSSTSSEYDCYLFKYWCSCYGNACFAIVRKNINQQGISCEGTVYDSGASYRNFHYENGEFTVDGCWHNIASFDEELEGLPTEDKSVTGAINEIYQKIGSSSGGGSGSKGLAYTLSNDGTYYIVSDIGTCTDTDVIIPATYNGKPVKGIRNYAFEDCSSLISVTIPDSVIEIGICAFRKCSALTSVTIGNGVTSISKEVFGKCSNLTSIVIPDGVTSIGSYAFTYCTSLTSITIPDSVTSIGEAAFYNCPALISITIPCSVVSIGMEVFSNCPNLTIYSETISQPEGWNKNWISSGSRCPVVWGYPFREINAVKDPGIKMITTTYSKLKYLRDNSKLVAGMFYRITDYVCTTTQAETRAMDNKFDIIVQALSTNTLSETASADYHMEASVAGCTFKPEVLADEDGTLVEGAVTKYYDIYEDCDDIENKTANYKSNDTFVEYGYLENNEGTTVPVLYKNDLDSCADEGADYNDIFYYVGTYEYEGTTYDKWRKIETSGYGWDVTGKIYALTNVIVDGGASGGYFDNANLPAWELKYCLDNDTTRFAWAMEGQAITNIENGNWFTSESVLVRYPEFDDVHTLNKQPEYKYAWGTQEAAGDGDPAEMIYSINEKVVNGESVYYPSNDELFTAEVIEGKGVIYYMKDEHNNECPYDFKNIQFKRMVSLENGYPELDTENGTETWVYTFCGNSYHIDNDEWSELKDGSLESPYGHMSDEGNYTFQCNIIKPYILNVDWNEELPTNCGKAYLNNNVFFGWWEEIGSDLPDNYPYYYMYGCAYNTFGYNCHDNTMGRSCKNNIFGNKCESNTFDCIGNCNFGNYFSGQHITAWDKNYSYKKYEHLIELTSNGTVYLNGIPYKFMLFAHRVKDFSYNSSTISDYFPDGCRIGVTGYVSYNVDSDNESTLIPYFIWRSNNQITIFVNDPNKEIKSLSFSISKFKITSHVYEI